METAAQVLVALVALIHAYFLVLEMFLWDTPRGRKAFGTTEAFSAGERHPRRQPGPLQRLHGRRAGLEPGRGRPGRPPGADLLPELPGRRRGVRSRHRQPQDPVRPGDTGRG